MGSLKSGNLKNRGFLLSLFISVQMWEVGNGVLFLSKCIFQYKSTLKCTLLHTFILLQKLSLQPKDDEIIKFEILSGLFPIVVSV